MLEDIAQAAEVLRKQTDSSDEQLITALVKAGFDQARAIKMVEFIPLAYGRAWMEGKGVQFTDYYLRMSEDGESYTEHELEDEPVYREAAAAAQSEIAAGSGFDELFPIAGRSAEFRAINSALHGGSRLEDLELSPPIFLWEGERQASKFSDKRAFQMTGQLEDEQDEESRLPVCPLCGGQRFRKEKGILDGRGFTTHTMILLICKQCQFVLHFYDGNSIFDLE